MAARLETLDPGTPVFCGEQRVGEIRGVFAEGDAKLAEYIAVYWQERNAAVLVATRDVERIDDGGVFLQGSDPQAYDSLATFEITDHPTIRKIH